MEPHSKPWFKGYLGSSFKKGGGVKRDVTSYEKEIEDLLMCEKASNNNLQVIADIHKKSPDLWPSSQQFKQPKPFSEKLSSAFTFVFVLSYVFLLAVAAFYLKEKLTK